LSSNLLQAQHLNVLVVFASQSFSISHIVNKLWRMHKGGHLSKKKQENKVNIILFNKEKMTWWRRHKDLLDKANIISWVHRKETKIPHKKWTCKLWDSSLRDLDHGICQIFNLDYYQYNNQNKKPYDFWYQLNSFFIFHRVLHMMLNSY
jgi:hypothetical protein